MINANIVRETENVSRIQDVNKQPPSSRRALRMKTNALSDVQNILHSRPIPFGQPSNSGIKAPKKLSTQSTGRENIVKREKIGFEGKPKPTSVNTFKELHSVPNIHSNYLEYHNHILCEQAENSSVNDFLLSYKLSDSQINALTKSVKNFVSPVTFKVTKPCEDIEIPIFEKSEDIFSINDVFSDILPVEIEAPSW